MAHACARVCLRVDMKEPKNDGIMHAHKHTHSHPHLITYTTQSDDTQRVDVCDPTKEPYARQCERTGPGRCVCVCACTYLRVFERVSVHVGVYALFTRCVRSPFPVLLVHKRRTTPQACTLARAQVYFSPACRFFASAFSRKTKRVFRSPHTNLFTHAFTRPCLLLTRARLFSFLSAQKQGRCPSTHTSCS